MRSLDTLGRLGASLALGLSLVACGGGNDANTETTTAGGAIEDASLANPRPADAAAGAAGPATASGVGSKVRARTSAVVTPTMTSARTTSAPPAPPPSGREEWKTAITSTRSSPSS